VAGRAAENAAGPPQDAGGRIGPGLRVWLQAGGEPVFGPGMLRLLVLTAQLGSLNKAAGKLGMSYSKAHRMLHKAEEELEVKLLERRIGGVDGGGSALTPDGERLVAAFVALRQEAYDNLHDLFQKHFGSEAFARADDEG
jgi:molybdate transport system regulatory protein